MPDIFTHTPLFLAAGFGGGEAGDLGEQVGTLAVSQEFGEEGSVFALVVMHQVRPADALSFREVGTWILRPAASTPQTYIAVESVQRDRDNPEPVVAATNGI